MKRQRLSMILAGLAVLFATLWLAACAGPAITPSDSSSAQPTPPATSHGGPAVDYVGLVDSLRAAGAAVEPAGSVSQPFFAVEGQVLKVNSSDVQVFEYESEAAARADATQVAADGTSIGTHMVTWMATPHFYRAGSLIVLYVGDDVTTIEMLESVLGEQFAGGSVQRLSDASGLPVSCTL